jgi:sugar phosphate isomerase/epimerase
MDLSSRRNFLKTTTLSVAATGGEAYLAKPAHAQIGEETTPLKLGTVTYNIAKDWTLDEVFKNLEEVQFEGVELRTTHAHGVEVTLSAEERETVKKRFADSPIELVQLGSAFEYHSPDQEEVRKNIEGSKEFIKLAHDVGAPGIKVRPNGIPAEVPEEMTIEQIGKSLREVGEFADGYGVEVRVEVHGRESSRIPRIKKMMDIADHPLVVVNWNSNQTDLEDGGFESNFDLVKDKIKHVHIVDLFREDYPWRRLFERLKEINYEGYCCAEIPASSDPLRVLRYYRALFLAYQGAL